MKAHLRVLLGVVQAPEGRGVFPGMTVQENLDMGHYARKFGTQGRLQGNAGSGVRRCSRGWPSAAPRSAGRCPAASSRWWRSAGR